MEWHRNGQRASESTWRSGKKEGTYVEWYDNGQKGAEGTYQDGRLEGAFSEWHRNGQKKAQGTYLNGRAGNVSEWNEEGQPWPATLNTDRVRDLVASAERRVDDPAVRVRLGNFFFDAEQYKEAARWYESALALDPSDVNVSTDLGVSYYYMDQVDRAVGQFEKSLKVDPIHTKTLLNMGIVLAFGKQDLQGAGRLWRQVVAIAPKSAEGQAAQQALDSMARR